MAPLLCIKSCSCTFTQTSYPAECVTGLASLTSGLLCPPSTLRVAAPDPRVFVKYFKDGVLMNLDCRWRCENQLTINVTATSLDHYENQSQQNGLLKALFYWLFCKFETRVFRHKKRSILLPLMAVTVTNTLHSP